MSDVGPCAERAVIAIDPGTAKCGVALVNRADGAVFRAVVASTEVAATVRRLMARFPSATVIVGDGTGSAALLRVLADSLADLELRAVPERGTSILARERFLSDHPPRGWRRLVPVGLRYPDAPYDDYVAVILAERWLALSCAED